MVSSDFRAKARKELDGKWGKAALICLAYMAIFFILGFISGLFSDTMESLISLISTIIEVPLSFGFVFSLYKLYNNEDIKAFDFCSFGFNNFKKAWGISFQIFLKMIVPVILIIISYILIAVGIAFMAVSVLRSSSTSYSFITLIGFILLIVSMIWAIVKSYYYQLAYIIAVDNPEMSSKDAVLKSEELMTDKRGKLFCLQFSFIGWAILACFTLGIGYLWLLPYIQFSNIAFYKFAKGDNLDVESKVLEKDTNIDPIQ